MSRSTPGPWRCGDALDIWTVGNPSSLIGYVFTPRLEAEANAALIAAAPELQDALRALMHEIDETEAANREYGAIVGEGPPFGSDGWQNAIALARAALAKVGE